MLGLITTQQLGEVVASARDGITSSLGMHHEKLGVVEDDGCFSSLLYVLVGIFSVAVLG